MLQRIVAAGKRFRGLDAGVIMENSARFFISLALGMAKAFSSFAPFGVAFAACQPEGAAGLAAAAGAVIGYLLRLGFLPSLKYSAAVILIRWVYRILKKADVAGGRLYRPLVALASTAAIGFVYAFDAGFRAVSVAVFAAESFTCAAFAFFYDIALSPWNEVSDGSFGRLSHTVSTVLLAATVSMGLCHLKLFGVLSPGGSAAALFVMTAAFKGGIGPGAAVGAAVGAFLDLASGTMGLYTAIFSVSAVVSGIFSKSGRLVFALSYVAIDAVAVLWGFGRLGSLAPLYDCFAASVILVMLPDGVISKLGSLFPLAPSGYGYARARELARRRLQLAGSAFGTLTETAKSIASASSGSDDPAKVFDAACEAVCKGCGDFTRCWQREYQTTRDALNSVTGKLSDSGEIALSDLPDYFADGCRRYPALVAAVNSEARSLRQRRQFSRRLVYMREAGLSQYGGLSELLASLARSLGEEVRVEPRLEKRIISRLSAMGIGVSAAALRLKGGRLRIELSGEALGELRRRGDWLGDISEVAAVKLRLADGDEGDGKLVLSEKPPFLAAFSAAKSGKCSGVSGDSCAGFLTDEGLFVLILADGMGTGPEAARISGAIVSSLRMFLSAGIAPELSLSLIDNMMFLKNEGDTESSTVDLLTVDCFTGEARFYKYGAAPSYVLRGGRIKEIGSRLLPAGLSAEGGVRDRGRRLRLADGDAVVIVSDGVPEGLVRSCLEDCAVTEPRALSKLIMERVAAAGAVEDDMTVLCLSLTAEE